MNDPEIQQRIGQDVMDGRQAGVNSTPSVFINGRLLRNRTLSGFEEVIDKELEKLKK
jgi:protein-disulfide isomerase